MMSFIAQMITFVSTILSLSVVAHQRTEWFYYDGVRRIQEMITDPILSQGGAESSGDPELVLLASQSVPPGSNPDGSAAPATLEEGLMDGPGGGGTPNRQMDREYVWGPGDGGVDELLAQYDRTGAALFAIQDDSGDLVALCDLGGPNSDGRVVAQWTYDPYGAVLSAEHLHAFAYPHLGHKGLFFDRLDVPVVDGSGNENPRLVPFGHNISYNRGRVYNPQLGRFMQMDPNQTAMTLLEAASYHGRGMGALALAFDLGGLYGDGANLYEYLGSNPVMRSDPLGLAYDPFDMVDDYLAASAGERAAFLSQLGQDAKAAAVVSATIVSYLPFPFVGNVGDLALYALGEQSSAELATAVALGIVPGGKLAGKLGSFLGRISNNAFETAMRYAQGRGGRRFANADGLAGRAGSVVDRKPASLCNCFAAGVMVWTASGLTPIEEVERGDQIYTLNEETKEIELRPVLGRIETGQTALLEITLLHNSGRLEMIVTADEHPFWVDGRGWARADGLRPGTIVRTAEGWAEVAASAFTSRRATVYDLWVEGNNNYLIGASGVWVHNCVPLGKVVPFKDAQKATRGLSGDVQAHHLIEKRHFKHKTMAGNPDDFPGVVMTREDHQEITNALRRELPYGKRHKLPEIRRAYEKVYGPRGWWRDIEPHLR